MSADWQPRIAIIGAGVAGISTAVKLTRAGFHDVNVFERRQGAGGTWLANDYPGCAVDIPSYLYSFSFMTWDWSRTHASQAEILAYIQATLSTFNLGERITFGQGVRSVVWDDDDSAYDVTFDNGEPARFEVVISCVGLLNQPKRPAWPGLESYTGTSFHTAEWQHHQDLNGRTVAVVGTGASSAQVVPAIAPDVGHLFVFQREPGWVLPKGDRPFTSEERRRFATSAFARRIERFKLYRQMAQVVNAWREGSPLNNELRDTCLEFIDRTIQDEELRKALTPDFPYACKRVVRSDDFYPALTRDNVTLVPKAVDRLTAHGIVADGVEYPVDVIIMATGFTAQDFLSTIDVIGPGGRDLHETWGEEPQALVGAVVPGFPNFFIVYGPNTNGGGSIIFQIEQSANFVVRALRRARRRARIIEARPDAFARYEAWLDRTNRERLSAQTQCNNYYVSATGRNVTQWPLTHGDFRRANWLWQYRGLRFTRRVRTKEPADR